MDDYPLPLVEQNTPLLVALGVQSDFCEPPLGPLRDQAVLLRSAEPLLESDGARALLGYIQDDRRFRVKTAGRSLLLPPRRVGLPPDLDVSSPVLHSPFSPLTPTSPLYPDGLIDAGWLQKHQHLIPSILLVFYSLTPDPTLATLHDNKIKVDIHSLKSTLASHGFRTRLAVFVVADSPSLVQDRLDAIRKACALDPKLFFASSPQPGEPSSPLRTAENALTTLYPQAVDYYADLGRRARKKKGRGTAPLPSVPPTSGTSQTLPLAGWNFRYDFKSAVLADFRRDPDAALRFYEHAYENLLGSELLEATPSWSPRWDEGRLLADAVALRCLRCLLDRRHSTSAVRRWQYHRDRMADVVDRLGRGTRSYGWHAWEARWALAMAELSAGLASQVSPDALFLPPEKAVQGERLQPWDLLHHPGYWLRLAAAHTARRRDRARAIPDDDRRPPARSPASRVASKAFTYDTYLCPEPHDECPLEGGGGTDHSRLLVDLLARARLEFQQRRQHRLSAELALECAGELADAGDWLGVVELLEPLWRDMSFRSEGWLDVAEDLSWCLRAAALRTGRGDLVVAIDWELLSGAFSKQPNWHYDLQKSLRGLAPQHPPLRPSVATDDALLSPLSASFAFSRPEGKAGESAQAQLSITSAAQPGSAPVVLSRVEVVFSGMKTVLLQHQSQKSHQSSSSSSTVLSPVPLDEKTDFSGTCDLSFPPRRTAVFAMDIPLREPGEATASHVKLALSCDAFDLEHTARLDDARSLWYLSPSRRLVARPAARSLRVLPRPPKLEIRPLAPRDEYYTNEAVEIAVEIANAEDEDATADLDVTLFGHLPPPFRWEATTTTTTEASITDATDNDTRALSAPLGTIESGRRLAATLRIDPVAFSSRYDLALRVTYHLASDPATSVIQSATLQLNIANPFEANYDLLPRLHPSPWPSLFDMDEPGGLCQSWCLVTRYASFAAENLEVTGLDLCIQTPPGVQCEVGRRRPEKEGEEEEEKETRHTVTPKTIEEASFDIVARKDSLDDRGPVSLDASFVIRWRRQTTAETNTTTLPVPRLHILGTEPRVLASARYLDGLVVLDVVIENASDHFLTFGLSMEPSDEFAFSGPKQSTLHLLPVSRRAATYRLLPLARGADGAWLKPGLVVRDKYFQKVLRVIPTEGMRLDKDGVLVWVPGSDTDERSS